MFSYTYIYPLHISHSLKSIPFLSSTFSLYGSGTKRPHATSLFSSIASSRVVHIELYAPINDGQEMEGYYGISRICF